MTHPTGWPTAQRISNIPEVRKAIDEFADCAAEDNELAMVSAILNHSPASVRAAALPATISKADAKRLYDQAYYDHTDEPMALTFAKLVLEHAALSAAPAGGLGEVDVEGLIPEGWLLNSVDASMRAHGKSETISVMLVKDKAGRDAYHALSEEEQETALLFWCEHGYTIRDAITIAAQAIAAAQGEGK